MLNGKHSLLAIEILITIRQKKLSQTINIAYLIVYKNGRLLVQIKCISKRHKKHISLISKTYT